MPGCLLSSPPNAHHLSSHTCVYLGRRQPPAVFYEFMSHLGGDEQDCGCIGRLLMLIQPWRRTPCDYSVEVHGTGGLYADSGVLHVFKKILRNS